MIACPKCGFVQPEDRFCANCGVDMKRYESRHQAKSVWQRLTSRSLFQALVIIGIVVITSIAIYRKKKAQYLTHLQKIQQASDQFDEDLSEISPVKKPSAAAARPQLPAPTVTPLSVTADESETELAGPVEEAKEEAKAPQSLATVKVFLAETSIGFLNRLGELRPLSGQGSTGGAIVPQLESRLQSGRSTQEVRSIEEEKVALRLGQTSHFSKTAVDENNMPLGLEVEFRPTAIDERGLQFQITVTRTLRESPYRYTESVALPSQAGLFIFGLLPRRKPQPGETFLPEVFQDVMNSPDFLSGASDLVLFVEDLPEPR